MTFVALKMALLRKVLTRKFNTSAILRSEDAHHEQAVKAAKLWKNMTYFVAIPSILIAMANVYVMHTSNHHERPPYVPYEYLTRRIKKFPWGDGNHGLFHNPAVNPIPGGYET